MVTFSKGYEIRDGERLLGSVRVMWSETRPHVWHGQASRFTGSVATTETILIQKMPSGRKRGARWHWWLGGGAKGAPHAEIGYKSLGDCRAAAARAAFDALAPVPVVRPVSYPVHGIGAEVP